MEAEAKGYDSTGKKQFILIWRVRDDLTEEEAFELSFEGSGDKDITSEQISEQCQVKNQSSLARV